MKIKTKIPISSLYAGIMLFLLYHIVFVKLPFLSVYIAIQRLFIMILGMMILPKIRYIGIDKRMICFIAAYLFFTLISAVRNEDHYSYSHPLISGLFYTLTVIELLAVFSYVIKTKGIKFIIGIFFQLSLFYIICNDLIFIFSLKSFGAYCLVGNKFDVSYKHIELIVLYCMKMRLNNRKLKNYVFPLFIIIFISLYISIKVNCMTGAVGIVLVTAILFSKAENLLDNRMTFGGVLIFSAVFPFSYRYIIEREEVRYFVVNVLHRTAGLTGRTEIFVYLPEILDGHLIFGYGYNTAYEVWITYTDWYPNAQNGFWNCVCEQGIIAAVLLAIIVMCSMGSKNCDGNIRSPLIAVLYVYAILGMVEITMDAVFLSWAVLLYIVKNNNQKESCREMPNPLISVIVPVYNGEKYIGECIKSILGQTFTDFELIIQNDGSKDGTESICRLFCDKRIRYYHHTNIGVSLTRQKGVRLSKGRYIAFVDGDDTIKPDFLKRMLKELQSTDCDIVCCNSIDMVKYDTDIDISKDETITDKERIFRAYFDLKRYATCIWGKLYKRELFEKIIFPDMKYAEDTYVVHQCFQQSENIRLIKYRGYIYRDNPDGAMHNISGMQESLDMLICNYYICGMCIKKYPQLKETAQQKLISCMFDYIIHLSVWDRNLRKNNRLIEKSFDLVSKKTLQKTMKGRTLLFYQKHPDFALKILECYYTVKHDWLKR